MALLIDMIEAVIIKRIKVVIIEAITTMLWR